MTYKILSYTDNVDYIEILNTVFPLAHNTMPDLASMIKKIISDKYSHQTIEFIFIDCLWVSNEALEAKLKQIKSLTPNVFIFLVEEELSESRFYEIQALCHNQVFVLEKHFDLFTFKQLILQLTRCTGLLSNLGSQQADLMKSKQIYTDQKSLLNELFGQIKLLGTGEIVALNDFALRLLGGHAIKLIGQNINTIFPTFKEMTEVDLTDFQWSEVQFYNYLEELRWGRASIRVINHLNDLQYLMVFQDISEQKQTSRTLAFKQFQEGIQKAKSELLHNLGNTLNSMQSNQSMLNTKLAELSSLSLYINRWIGRSHQQEKNSIKSSEDFINLVSSALDENIIIPLKEYNQVLDQDIQIVIETLEQEPSSGGASENVESINIYNMVRGVVSSIQAFCDERGVTIKLMDDETRLRLLLSRNELFQVLLNLFKNSVEAFEDAEHTKKIISVQTVMKGNGDAVIVIHDDGIGISKNHIEGIFKHGYTTKISGTGQGLHSVANFMNMLGGEVLVESMEEVGTTFKLIFPSVLVSWTV